jgi:hypothetical protein
MTKEEMEKAWERKVKCDAVAEMISKGTRTYFDHPLDPQRFSALAGDIVRFLERK